MSNTIQHLNDKNNRVFYFPDFIPDTDQTNLESFLYVKMLGSINTPHLEFNWDKSMANRYTLSWGVPYNYNQMTYPKTDFPPMIKNMAYRIYQQLGFYPNNCLVNYYMDGKSKMGFHSDEVDQLAEGTGVAILSFGCTRTLAFKSIATKQLTNVQLANNSLFYMTGELQKDFKHAILADTEIDSWRVSFTFRKLKTPANIDSIPIENTIILNL